MRRKKIISVIAVILAVLMALSLLLSIIPTLAYADESDDAQLSALQQAKSELSSQRASAQSKLDQLKDEQAAVIDQKIALEERNKCAQDELDLIAEEIALYNDKIAQKAEELDQAKNREAVQLEKYRTRIRAMEENGGYNILSLVLQTTDFSELLSAMDDMGDIMNSDKLLSDRYKEAREDTEQVKAEYEAYKAEVEQHQAELETEKAEIEAQIKESEATLEELAEAIKAAEAEQEAAAAAEAAASASIVSFIADYNARKAAETTVTGSDYTQSGGDSSGDTSGQTGSDSSGTSSGGTTYTGAVGTGSFIWPVPSTYKVSSTFKVRWGRQHTGIDIDGFGLDGNAIVAADAGTVIKAEYYGGYGNCVVIDHGNGTNTLYGHMSGFAVSAGQSVSQGQTIGYLGSTGNSTGTHCHFEIIINGTQVDPLPYFSGYVLEDGA